MNKQIVDYKKNGWGYHSMEPEEITIHNTANSASAQNERDYVENQLKAGKSTATYHFAIDEAEVIQLLPLDISGWHSGDGENGIGNRKSIGIEICRSTGDLVDYKKAEQNAIQLVADLINDGTIKSVDKIKLHFDRSGKNCPHKMIEIQKGTDNARNYFRNSVSNLLSGVTPKPEPEPTKYDKQYKESGQVTFVKDNAYIRNTPFKDDYVDGKVKYLIGETLHKYDEVIYNQGYIWVGYNRNSGGRGYVPTGSYDPNTLKRIETWCEFK